MSIQPWPESLPQVVLYNGYQEIMPDNKIKTSMDIGPAKVRRRGTSGVIQFGGKMVLTLTQLNALIAFYRETLLEGTLRFSWSRMTDGTAIEVRFLNPPTWTAIAHDLYDVSLQFEILP